MSQVRRLDQIPAALTVTAADQIAVWQDERTRIGRVADLIDAASTGALAAVNGAVASSVAAAVPPAITTALASPSAKTALNYTSADVSTTAPGAGSVARTTLAKLGEVGVSPEDKGATADGVATDTTAVSAAITAAGTADTLARARYKTAGFSVPRHARMKGQGGNGIVRYDADHYGQAGTVRLTAGQTIIGGAASALEDLHIVRDGMVQPTNTIAQARANIAAFSGTAYQASGFDASDAMIRNSSIIGANQAVSVDGQDAALFAGRFDMRDVKIDANAGLFIKDVADVARIDKVHCWPFTAYVPGSAPADPASFDILQRSGSAFYTKGACDWIQFTGCFSYGYAYGAIVENVSNAQFINHQVDNVAVAAGTGVFKQAAYSIRGTSEMARLLDVTSVSHPIAVEMSTGSPNATRPNLVELGGFHIANSIGYNIVTGNARLKDAVVAGAQRGLYLRAGAGDCTFHPLSLGGGENYHVGTGITVDAGYAGYLDVRVPKMAPGAWDTLFSIPEATLRNGRCSFEGDVPKFAYTPTVTATGSTFSAISGSFLPTGRHCKVNGTATVATSGTGAITIGLPLPGVAGKTQYLTGSRETVGGEMLKIVILPGAATAQVYLFNNTTALSVGAVINWHGEYEI